MQENSVKEKCTGRGSFIIIKQATGTLESIEMALKMVLEDIIFQRMSINRGHG
jgi:hypothetical protein